MDKGINVLSLFDGMSCGQIALERAGIKVNNYFASEIDKYGQIVSKANYPNTIYLGDVRHINANDLPKTDLIIGGSPCQSFSFAGKRKGMSTKDEQQILTLDHYLQLKSEGFEFEGQSYLFWEYMRLLNECNPKYFLLENVEMGEKWEKVLSKAIGVNGIHINSALLSAQNRKRIYWTNIGMQAGGLFGDLQSIIEQPKDKGILLKDVLESEVLDKYYLSDLANKRIIRHKNNSLNNEKSNCILAGYFKGGGRDQQYITHNTMPRSSTTGNTNAIEIVAMRGRPNKDGINIQQLEHRDDNKTNCLTSVQKDNLVIQIGNHSDIDLIVGLTEVRTIEAKQIRKETGTNPKRAKELVLRTDGKIGAILTSQTPDNLILVTPNIRRLTPLECERLQTVPDNYTNHVSDSQRYKMLGNGWTVDVISHIFKYL